MKKLDPIEFALDFERKGTIIYLDLAKGTKNLLGKRLFYSLAKQEVDHAKRADEIQQMINSAKGAGIDYTSQLPPVEKELKDFFQKAKKINLLKDADNLSGYKLAMEMERKGYKAYTEFCDNAANKDEERFFEYLIQEEKTHLDSLANVYYYLTKTGDWLDEEESRVWNWMNL